MKEFIARVNDRIEELGITMPELAKRSGVSREYIYRILAGTQKPSMEVAEKIAKPLGLAIEVVDAA